MCPRERLRGQGSSQGLHFCIISLERASNNLACAHQFFLCLFCARFALLKTGLLNRNLTKKGLKIKLFLQKNAKVFLRFFFETPVQSHKF